MRTMPDPDRDPLAATRPASPRRHEPAPHDVAATGCGTCGGARRPAAWRDPGLHHHRARLRWPRRTRPPRRAHRVRGLVRYSGARTADAVCPDQHRRRPHGATPPTIPPPFFSSPTTVTCATRPACEAPERHGPTWVLGRLGGGPAGLALGREPAAGSWSEALKPPHAEPIERRSNRGRLDRHRMETWPRRDDEEGQPASRVARRAGTDRMRP